MEGWIAQETWKTSLSAMGTAEFTCQGGKYCIHEPWVCDGHTDSADEVSVICSSNPDSLRFGGSELSELRVTAGKSCAVNEFQC